MRLDERVVLVGADLSFELADSVGECGMSTERCGSFSRPVLAAGDLVWYSSSSSFSPPFPDLIYLWAASSSCTPWSCNGQDFVAHRRL